MTHFRWLGDSNGPKFKTGHIYKTADFGMSYVGALVAAGLAERVEVKATNTVLDVKSVSVKPKAPQIGAEL